jgi:hypothetical protein
LGVYIIKLHFNGYSCNKELCLEFNCSIARTTVILVTVNRSKWGFINYLNACLIIQLFTLAITLAKCLWRKYIKKRFKGYKSNTLFRRNFA